MAQSHSSIAVLAFEDMSPEKDQEYFCDGLAEEIINNLVQLGGLRVASRTSSFAYNGKPEDVRDIQHTLSQLSEILRVDRVRLDKKFQGIPKGAPFRPIVLNRDMTRDQVAAVETQRFHLPGVMVQIEPRRSYERPSFAAHLIGYLGEIEAKGCIHAPELSGLFLLGVYSLYMYNSEFILRLIG